MTMTWLLRIVLTTVFVTMAALLLDRIAVRSRGWIARSRRWIWGAAMAASAALPVLSVWGMWGHPMLSVLLRWPISYRTTAELQPTDAGGMILGPPPASTLFERLQEALTGGFRALWTIEKPVIVTCLVLSVLGLMLFAALHLWIHVRRRQWVQATLDGMPVLVAPAVGPAVVGVRDPAIVIPAWVMGAPSETQHAILQHEHAHIATGDSRMLALGAFLLALMPWNVALWWQYRRLRLTVETDCDARVLANGVDVRKYGEMLLGVATRAIPVPLLSPAFCANPSLIERRIVAMTCIRARYSRFMLGAYGAAATVAFIAAFDASSQRIPELITQVRMSTRTPLQFYTDVQNERYAIMKLTGGTFDVEVQIGGKPMPAPTPASLATARVKASERVNRLETVRVQSSPGTEVVIHKPSSLNVTYEGSVGESKSTDVVMVSNIQLALSADQNHSK